jgi:hypothetical protein
MYALDPSKNTAWRRTCFVCLIPKGASKDTQQQQQQQQQQQLPNQ